MDFRIDFHVTGDDTDEAKAERVERCAGGQMVVIDPEERAVGQGGGSGRVQGRGGVGEVDAGEGLGDVQGPGAAVEAGAIPVENAIGSVAVLLDLENDEARADGVESAAGDEDGVACFHWEARYFFCHGAAGERLLEGVAVDTWVDADPEDGIGLGFGDEPHFCFWFSPELGGD